MRSVGRPAAPKAGAAQDYDYPLEASVGYQLRRTYRFLAQELQVCLLPHEIPIGMWYFLRVLWEQDGLTQREISERVGATAPTTVEQLRNMERRGFITRVRDPEDRRKVRVFLDASGWALKPMLLPFAEYVVGRAIEGLSEDQVGVLRLVLRRMQDNIARGQEGAPPTLDIAGGRGRRPARRR